MEFPAPGALEVRRLEARYGQTQVLFGVDLSVSPGEIVALLGTNGAGKSTLLRAVGGSVPSSGGTVAVGGREVTGWSAPEAAAAGVVVVPGGKGVFPGLTVQENFELAGWLFHRERGHLEHSRRRAFEAFPVLQRRWHERAGNLSGGEQQMLTLAQALITRPQILMIDELSLGLAPALVEQLLGTVRDINAAGTTVILVEQSVNVALTAADRAVFMEKGEVRFDGAASDLLARPDILRSVFLEGAAAVAPREAEPVEDTHPLPQLNGPSRSTGQAILEARDLSVSFGGVHAVRDVQLEVMAGEILGIIGPNGAGKTTLFDLFSGFVAPSHGQVLLSGRDVTGCPPDERARLGMGRSFQDARLFPSLTVAETIAVAFERHVAVRDPVAAALGSPQVRRAERALGGRVDDLIALMGLGAYTDKFVSELSTGTRRIVDLACCMAHDPVVLLLDEPSAGIAQREVEALAPVLRSLRRHTDTAIVVIEHDMPLLTSVSDRLVALELGQVVVTGSPQEVLRDPRVVASYLGEGVATVNRSGPVSSPWP